MSLSKWVFPVIRNMPDTDLLQIFSQQPLSGPSAADQAFEFKISPPPRPRSPLWVERREAPDFYRSLDEPILTVSGSNSGILVSMLLFKWNGTKEQFVQEQVDDNVYHRSPEEPDLAKLTACSTRDRVSHNLKDMIEGDEIFEYSTGAGSWRSLAGRAGFLVIRDLRIVTGYLTRLS